MKDLIRLTLTVDGQPMHAGFVTDEQHQEIQMLVRVGASTEAILAKVETYHVHHLVDIYASQEDRRNG